MKNLIKSLALVSILTAAFSGSVLAKPQGGTAKEAIDFLVKKFGASQAVMTGHSQEEYFDCAIELKADNNELTAFFYYPEGSSKDVRAVFRLTDSSKVTVFDTDTNIIEVKNKMIETAGTQTRKVTRTSRIELKLNADGSIHYVNLGWAEDNGFPLPMYGCVVN